ncbi:MAG TPA: hypothetical protein VMT24_02785 [Aggregatilineaceae bacterium]|nr:hypothetical protein [Aggregatilineaceae bacterium]
MRSDEHPGESATTQAADRDGPGDQGQGDDVHVVYYDYPLDQAHDSAGYAEEQYDEGEWRQLYDAAPTLLQKLWWQSRVVVYLISFAIPLLLLLLPIAIWLIARAGERSGSASPPNAAGSAAQTSPTGTAISAWPPDVAFVPNTVPAMIRDELALAGERRGYLFQGTAGHPWHILVEPEDASAIDPLITLYAPSGGVLAVSDNEDTGAFAAEIRITLPESGPYRLLVKSAQGGLTTGTFLLTLYEE